ncbi:Tetracycline resistance protein, class C [Acinetobacter baumannii]|nr:Tetracycline resistance protein, class C [Acinetobacter baumannii]CAI4207399.1 Tetracycline resistance protein, class C [Acinetobacter baumannii]
MNRSLFIIFATIALDAIGISLIFPILPLLLQDMTHSTHISIYIWVYWPVSMRPCNLSSLLY